MNKEYCKEKEVKKNEIIIEDDNNDNNDNNDNDDLELLGNIDDSNLKNKSIYNKPLAKNNDNEFNYLINSDLEKIELNNLSNNISNQNNESINLKSHDEIYLEIYKTAIKKAKEIRNNAIAAFLEAKKIKNTYNLDSLDLDTSDDEEDFINMN